ncbi:MAG: phosphoribosyltransferase [Anaeromyxobacteraceae bacterium]
MNAKAKATASPKVNARAKVTASPKVNARAKPSPRGAAAAAPKRARKPRRRAEQPLGEGVADAHALKRLHIPPQRAEPAKEVREVGWAEFGALAKELGDRIAQAYRPDVVVGVANGGVFIGGALATALRAEFQPLRVPKDERNKPVAEPLPDLRGKAVLVVDDVIMSGKTLAAASGAARKAGASEVRTAALVARPDRSRPDFHALETSELVVFGWDYQLDQGGATGTDDPGEQGV